MKRSSRILPSASTTYPQTDSPLVIAHSSFEGLALSFSNGAAVATVEVDTIKDGDFEEEVTLEGTSKNRWPDIAGINTLKSTAYVKITWDVGTLQVFQKS